MSGRPGVRRRVGRPRIRCMTDSRYRVWPAWFAVFAAGSWLLAQPNVVPPQIVGAQRGVAVNVQPIYIEDSPAAQELADKAMQLRDLGRFTDAVQTLQQMTDDYRFKLMPAGDRIYTDAPLWIRRALLDDPRLLSAYRASFGPAAERAFILAMPTAHSEIDPEGLWSVLSRYTLTPAGLDAGLALGSYYLERANGDDAAGVLDALVDHPDLPAHAGRYHFLGALAGLLTSDAASYDQHRGRLEQLDEDRWLSELDALSNRIHPPIRLRQGQTDLASSPSRLPVALDAPLWQVALSQRQPIPPQARASLRGTPASRLAARVLPVDDGMRIYINTGDRIMAYDRASGWPLWEALGSGDDVDRDAAEQLRRSIQALAEPRGVLVVGDRAFGVRGMGNPQPRAQPGWVAASLIGIDTADGRLLWDVQPGDLDDALSRGFFYGTPTGDAARVYALVKRAAVSGFHDLYLTAIDGADGTLIWRRHLSSGSVQGTYGSGPPARMILRGGRVYISDNRGAVVSLDARTGAARWVSLLADLGKAPPPARRTVQTWTDRAEPVLVEAGLIVPPAGEGGQHVLLDARTGRLLRSLDDGDWAGVDAVYSAGASVLGVGDAVTYFDGATLEPRWRTPLDPGRYGRALGRPAIGLHMTAPGFAVQPQDDTEGGAPGKTPGLAVLCTDRRLVVLALDDGAVVADPELDEPGNLLLAPGQIVLATDTDMGSYMDWPAALEQLRAQAQQRRFDPQPGMALGYLALRVGQDQAVLEGVDLALGALGRLASSPPAGGGADVALVHQQVFDRLQRFASPAGQGGVGAAVELRGAVLDRMASVAATPGQEAAYQLLRGGYLEETGQPTRAAEHYQAVLSDRSLSDQIHRVGHRSLHAGLEARRLLKALIQAHGRTVYQRFDALAEHELQQMLVRSDRDAADFIRLADRYPLAVSATDARLHAATLLVADVEHTAALRQLQAVYLDTDRREVLSDVAGRITDLQLAEDRPGLARRWLRRVGREHPGMTLTRVGQPTLIEAWVSELDLILAGRQRLPKWAPPLGEPRWIKGRVLTADHQASTPPPSDRVLMRVGQTWRLLTGPGLEPIWQIPLPAPDAELLTMDPRQVLWWSPATGMLGAIDSQTGEPLWQAVDVAGALEQAGDPRLRLEERTRKQREFVQLLGGRQPRRQARPALQQAGDPRVIEVGLAAVCIADRSGRVICIDRGTGQVRWRTLCPADNLSAMSLGDGLLAVGGASWADTQAQSGVVGFLDVLTGEPVGTSIQVEAAPLWVGFADNGLLMAVTAGQVLAYEPGSGRTVWRHRVTEAPLSGRGWVGDRLLMLVINQGAVGSAQVLDTDDGRVVNRLAISTRVSGVSSFDVVRAQGFWHVMSPMQAVTLSASGRTVWSDGICAQIGHLSLQRVGERYVVLVGRSEASSAVMPQLEQALRLAVAAGQGPTLPVSLTGYRLFMLDRQTGALAVDTDLPALPGPIEPRASRLLDGVLLLGSGDQTLVIPSIHAVD